MRKFKQFFTLIELLVVVAIILILLSLIQPALRKALYNAKLVTCINGLKQYGAALYAASDDNNGFWPRRVVNSTSSNPQKHLFKVGQFDDRRLLEDYIDINTQYCPFTFPESYDPLEVDTHYVKVSYEMYFGSEIRKGQKETGMLRVGDRAIYVSNNIEYEFNVLVADIDRYCYNINRYTMSHPDESGIVPFVDGKPPYIKNMYETVYSGNIPQGYTRGIFDRNFLFDDGSVFLMQNVSAPMEGINDDRLVQIDYWARGRSIAFGYLPPVGNSY